MSSANPFIRTVFANTAGPVFICSLPNIKGTGPGERSLITRDLARIGEFMRRWDTAGRATYFCTATLKPDRIKRAGHSERCEENVAEIVGLHADIDFKNTKASPAEIRRDLTQLPCRPTIIVNSGHGLHCYWLFREPIGTDLGKEITDRVVRARERLAELLAGDPVQDLPRLMRLPGSHNTKNGDAIVVIIEEIAAARRYDLEELEFWLAEQRPLFERIGGAIKPIGSNGARMPPEHWLELVVGGVGDGNRNIQTARLAGHLLRNSWLDPRIVLGLIQCWNVAACKPPLEPEEITGIVNRIAGRELRKLENA